jgi:DNA-binding PadR family transcriptional regulator
MGKKAKRIELLQGTLDMLILRTLLFGVSHGHQIASTSSERRTICFKFQHGSLYPALHRL